MKNSKQAGYSFKNYLIESSWRSVRGAGLLSMTLAAIPQAAFWFNVVAFVEIDWYMMALLLPASTILWFALWWAIFDRLITYVSWLANYREMYEMWLEENEQNPPAPQPQITRVYNQLDKTTYTIDTYPNRVGGKLDKSPTNGVQSD